MAPNGVPGNGLTSAPHLSADGRFVAMESRATNLVAPCTNGQTQTIVFDRARGAFECVSMAGGVPGNGFSGYPKLKRRRGLRRALLLG